MSFSFYCMKCGYPLQVNEENIPDGRFWCPECHQRYSIPLSEEGVREQATQSIAKAKENTAPATATHVDAPVKAGHPQLKAPPKLKFKVNKAPHHVTFKT